MVKLSHAGLKTHCASSIERKVGEENSNDTQKKKEEVRKDTYLPITNEVQGNKESHNAKGGGATCPSLTGVKRILKHEKQYLPITSGGQAANHEC